MSAFVAVAVAAGRRGRGRSRVFEVWAVVFGGLTTICWNSRACGVGLDLWGVLKDYITWPISVIALSDGFLNWSRVDLNNTHDLSEWSLLYVSDSKSNILVPQALDSMSARVSGFLFEIINLQGFNFGQSFIIRIAYTSTADLFQFNNLSIAGMQTLFVDFFNLCTLINNIDGEFAETVCQTAFGYTTSAVLFFVGKSKGNRVNGGGGWAGFLNDVGGVVVTSNRRTRV